jgi:hypothetical protein
VVTGAVDRDPVADGLAGEVVGVGFDGAAWVVSGVGSPAGPVGGVKEAAFNVGADGADGSVDAVEGEVETSSTLPADESSVDPSDAMAPDGPVSGGRALLERGPAAELLPWASEAAIRTQTTTHPPRPTRRLIKVRPTDRFLRCRAPNRGTPNARSQASA